MINITKGPAPAHLVNHTTLPTGEKNIIINLIETENKTWEDLKSFSFSAYSHDSVKRQLKIDFNSKCAYCESIFVHNSYGEVEHWRPKKAVKDNPSHNGYYWLAAEWDNLLVLSYM